MFTKLYINTNDSVVFLTEYSQWVNIFKTSTDFLDKLKLLQTTFAGFCAATRKLCMWLKTLVRNENTETCDVRNGQNRFSENAHWSILRFFFDTRVYGPASNFYYPLLYITHTPGTTDLYHLLTEQLRLTSTGSGQYLSSFVWSTANTSHIK